MVLWKIEFRLSNNTVYRIEYALLSNARRCQTTSRWLILCLLQASALNKACGGLKNGTDCFNCTIRPSCSAKNLMITSRRHSSFPDSVINRKTISAQLMMQDNLFSYVLVDFWTAVKRWTWIILYKQIAFWARCRFQIVLQYWFKHLFRSIPQQIRPH